MKITKEEQFKALIDRIKRLEALNGLSKHECIVQGVLDAIDANELEVHSSLNTSAMLGKPLPKLTVI